ncbi:homoserine O-succinyltransferase MetX [Tahibacter soli]|uniref:Homoserine O-succinyltransferase n=1 Tax=Tahibacter soli TaxID=2983605 RepID=A0A9X3YHX6_9GAMM|nr:homoserine O-succinyltransferase [Tahibacter soli]MDC8011326.1 homoserine O-succinyltransferase [Tahibacter soli]
MSLNAAAAFAPADDTVCAFDAVTACAPPQTSIRGDVAVRIVPKYGRAPVVANVRYLWHGADGAPTVIVQGGISASRNVCANGEVAGWWDDIVGVGRALDLSRFRVLSIEYLAAGDLGAPDAVSSEDQADAIAGVLDALGIDCAHAFVGASYGAMVGLALATRHPPRIGRLVAISGAHRAHPLATALRAIQREIIRGGVAAGAIEPALALARQLAMTTYRGADEFAERFDGEAQLRDGRFHFPVEDYLVAAGRKFVARFDAQRYLSLSESIDLHRVDPAALVVPATILAVTSDRLVPTDDLRALAAASAAPAELHEIDSRYGHDAFLKEPGRVGALVARALCC